MERKWKKDRKKGSKAFSSGHQSGQVEDLIMVFSLPTRPVASNTLAPLQASLSHNTGINHDDYHSDNKPHSDLCAKIEYHGNTNNRSRDSSERDKAKKGRERKKQEWDGMWKIGTNRNRKTRNELAHKKQLLLVLVAKVLMLKMLPTLSFHDTIISNRRKSWCGQKMYSACYKQTNCGS